jgi:hypothetical protein
MNRRHHKQRIIGYLRAVVIFTAALFITQQREKDEHGNEQAITVAARHRSPRASKVV